ncbi:MAG: T9SS type A sorting domain-containing protein, partial [Bacteroidales bacterium]|nr:T9SS type A sorting domain-containing protein [Bacteroidales bacterium]
IYSLDGKLIYYNKISHDKTIRFENLPKTTLIIKLLNEEGVFTRKIINNY